MREAEFHGIEDHAEYKKFVGSENRVKDGSFGEANGCASGTDRQMFGKWPGLVGCWSVYMFVVFEILLG